nr:Gfo/Idh/MocA family oxidoreductase [uncultured Desulfobacter sp.]
MLWLIGAGPMAVDYSKVLRALKTPSLVIGRGKESAEKFREKSGLTIKTDGLDVWLKKKPEKPDCAIVAVGVDQLANVTDQLLDFGVKKILLEKPGGLNSDEIQRLNSKALKKEADVYIAYNRRFYASVIQAQKMIKEDGGVTSFHFEFTELSHIIEKTNKPRQVLDNWFLANSTHVADLAFYLGGQPKELTAYTTGEVSWHPKAAIFAGAGISENDALFSYQANWDAPGRWGIEILTKKKRYYFRPLEQLHIQKTGSFDIQKIEIDDHLDRQFKPGLYLQTEAFINNNFERFSAIDNQSEHCKIYDLMIA